VEASGVDSLDGRGTRDPGDALARRELLAGAIRSLSPEQREVIVLRFYADLTVDQIAERTGARAGTVKSRLHYALRYLREDADVVGERRGPR
jgi:RNA polymerase sigma factor (sigma-70 family)